jgi:hypothetical protein
MWQYVRQTQLSEIWTVHSEEFERRHGYAKNELGWRALWALRVDCSLTDLEISNGLILLPCALDRATGLTADVASLEGDETDRQTEGTRQRASPHSCVRACVRLPCVRVCVRAMWRAMTTSHCARRPPLLRGQLLHLSLLLCRSVKRSRLPEHYHTRAHMHTPY